MAALTVPQPDVPPDEYPADEQQQPAALVRRTDGPPRVELRQPSGRPTISAAATEAHWSPYPNSGQRTRPQQARSCWSPSRFLRRRCRGRTSLSSRAPSASSPRELAPSFLRKPRRADGQRRGRRRQRLPRAAHPHGGLQCRGHVGADAETFADDVGLSDRELVALLEGHSIGQMHSDRSGFTGSWSKDPPPSTTTSPTSSTKTGRSTTITITTAMVAMRLTTQYTNGDKSLFMPRRTWSFSGTPESHRPGTPYRPRSWRRICGCLVSSHRNGPLSAPPRGARAPLRAEEKQARGERRA